MNLFDRIFLEPELRERPPVLVDVGAAGGIYPKWKRLAKYSIGVGFEPDAREAAALHGTHAEFKQWIFHPSLIVPAAPAKGQRALHLTRSPQCSSVLQPRADRLRDWAFADFFHVEKIASVAATTLANALKSHGLDRVDWLKCDTQGLDLGIFQSLPTEWRERLSVAEFEPGLIDAYEGEDKLPEVLAAMAREPFWLADLEIGRTPRGSAQRFGRRAARWMTRLAPTAPAWGNLCFIRENSPGSAALNRRGYLLAWVFSMELGQPGYALQVAERGREIFGGDLLPDLAKASEHALRWAMLRAFPGWAWRRLWRS
ncbi:hypothetical protein [Oleiharenicola lentus]|uniref:hypothetical protein n=1 Tax=Oleiharenicola lentus TaxID=2508720 RepID=UPI003F66FCAC